MIESNFYSNLSLIKYTKSDSMPALSHLLRFPKELTHSYHLLRPSVHRSWFLQVISIWLKLIKNTH